MGGKVDQRFVAVYCRVSTGIQREEGRSIENQEAMLRSVAGAHWPEVRIECYSDVASGRVQGRVAYQKMLNQVRLGNVKVVCAMELSRLWRNVEHAIKDGNRIRATGAEIYIHQLGLDSSTPAGNLMFQMLAILAEFESKQIGSRVKRAIRQARIEGRKGPGRRPFGWDVGESGLLERNAFEQETIDIALGMRSKGKTWRQVGTVLNVARRWTAGGKEWLPAGLRLVLDSAVTRRLEEAKKKEVG